MLYFKRLSNDNIVVFEQSPPVKRIGLQVATLRFNHESNDWTVYYEDFGGYDIPEEFKVHIRHFIGQTS